MKVIKLCTEPITIMVLDLRLIVKSAALQMRRTSAPDRLTQSVLFANAELAEDLAE